MQLFALLAALAATTTAYPHLTEQYEKLEAALDKRAVVDTHPYIAPNFAGGDVRAPCPGHNVLANHGFIHRNGKAVTKQGVQQGFLDAFNMAFDATDAGTTNAINLCSSITKTTCTSYNLDMLATPHQIEHDASLSRLDKQMAGNTNSDNDHFNTGIMAQTLGWWQKAVTVGIHFANTARLGRIAQAKQQDAPGWFRENDGGSLTEHAFYLTTMNDRSVSTDPNNPQARVAWVSYWFASGRLPTDLGWTKPTAPISNAQIQAISKAVGAASTVAPAPTKRALAPAVLSVVANPAKSSIVASAAAQATAQATAVKPALPNSYETVLSPDEWTALNASNAAFQADVQGIVNSILGNGGNGH